MNVVSARIEEEEEEENLMYDIVEYICVYGLSRCKLHVVCVCVCAIAWNGLYLPKTANAPKNFCPFIYVGNRITQQCKCMFQSIHSRARFRM